MKKFILAEKPSVASSFAQALGAKNHKGYFAGEEYTISFCLGHLLTLYDAKDYDARYQVWNVEDLPIIPGEYRYKPIENNKEQLETIRSLISGNQYEAIIIATDAGREGELIARLVLEHCGIKDYSRVYRFWTSSALTPEVIKETLGSAKPAAEYEKLYSSALARQHGDWIVGINYSRFFTVRFHDKFIFGRVQTPVLGLIVDRYNEIVSFVPKPFFKLKVSCSAQGEKFFAYYIENEAEEFPEKQKLLQIQEQIKARNTSVVKDVKKEKVTNNPPLLLDLTELQKIANTKYGYTAKETEGAAQSLYEKYKCLSYPRTSSRYMSQSNFEDFKSILEALQKSFPALFPDVAISIDNKDIFNDEAMQTNGDDHHALIVMAVLPEDAPEKERNVYNIVLNNMSCLLKPPFIYEKTIILHSIDDQADFITRGRTIIQEGWKAGLPKEKEEEEGKDEEECSALPPLQAGDNIALDNPVITEHKTKPKKNYTDASILTVMKKHSLGAPSTRYAIIESLISNAYCFRKAKQIIPTDKAFYFIKSIRELPSASVKEYLNIDTTEKWETLLESQPVEFYDALKETLQTTFQELSALKLERFVKTVGECPLCKSPLAEGKNNYYCSSYKTGCTFGIPKTMCGASLTPDDIAKLLEGKKTGVKSMTSKAGKPFKAQLLLNKDKIEFVFKDEKK
jgi:DNA topoisomerase-3